MFKGKIVCVERSPLHLEYCFWRGNEGLYKYLGLPTIAFLAFLFTLGYGFSLLMSLGDFGDFLKATNDLSFSPLEALLTIMVGAAACIVFWGLTLLIFEGGRPFRLMLDAKERIVRHSTFLPWMVSVPMQNITRIWFRSSSGGWPPKGWKQGKGIHARCILTRLTTARAFIAVSCMTWIMTKQNRYAKNWRISSKLPCDNNGFSIISRRG